MDSDIGSLQQEHYLAEYARRLGTSGRGRTAIHLHLSKLKAHHRRPFHLRMVRETVKPAVEQHQGQTFSLLGGDMMLVLRNAPPAAVDSLIDRLRFLFSEDPIAEGWREDESGQLATVYALERDYAAFRALAERLYKSERKRLAQLATRKGDGQARQPVAPRHMDRLLGAVDGADLGPMVRRQPICVAVPGGAPQPVLWEMVVDIDEVGRQIMPEVNLGTNRWYRGAFHEAVLKQLLVWLNRSGLAAAADPVSIDTTPDALLSSGFQALDASLNEAARRRTVFEFADNDVFRDLGTVMFLRNLLQDHGYRVCLDGANHLTFPLLDRTRLGFDLIKLRWGPDFETDLRRDRMRALSRAIGEVGATRVILSGCETGRALHCGQSLGITQFQGGYVDLLLRASAEAPAPEALARA